MFSPIRMIFTASPDGSTAITILSYCIQTFARLSHRKTLTTHTSSATEVLGTSTTSNYPRKLTLPSKQETCITSALKLTSTSTKKSNWQKNSCLDVPPLTSTTPSRPWTPTVKVSSIVMTSRDSFKEMAFIQQRVN